MFGMIAFFEFFVSVFVGRSVLACVADRELASAVVLGAVECIARSARPDRDHLHPAVRAQDPHLRLPPMRVPMRRDGLSLPSHVHTKDYS